MMKIVTLNQILNALPAIDLIDVIEQGFIAYSKGEVVVPPVGEMIFEEPPGDVHIKYGYIRSDDHFVIKIASGFYNNPGLGLPSSGGMMLLFSQKTGQPLAALLDEGKLTDLRTAAAGAIAAKHLAPTHVRRIGIVGTGIQARLQLRQLKSVTTCRAATVWGRSQENLAEYREEMEKDGFEITTTQNSDQVAAECNLIVTATPSTEPLLRAEHIRPGTHITAVGADGPHKQELDSAILKMADVLVADSIAQCLERGEIFRALQNRQIAKEDLLELGNVISGASEGRTSDEQITIADLTGVAVQDIQIAKAVYAGLGG
ncbi:MAG: ornithine cyclodeaminase family protein [Verrucomicrobiia bacterium]